MECFNECRRRARQTHFWKELGIALLFVFGFALIGVLILIFLNLGSSIRKYDEHPLGGRAGQAREMLQRTTVSPGSGGNQAVANSTSPIEHANSTSPTNSTSPIEHAKRDASLNWCRVLKAWEKQGAIKDDEKEVCCALYVKQACNETIAPDEPVLKPGICSFSTPEFFTKACVIKEKMGHLF